MRAFTPVLAAALLALAPPATVHAKIALNRAVVVEVHPPGSAKGMKYGAVTLVRLYRGAGKRETITAPLTAHAQLTRLGKKGRDKIALKNLKPGMVAVIEIVGSREPAGKSADGQGWQLEMLHVLGKAEDLGPALAKVVGHLDHTAFVRVTRVGPPRAGYEGDLGRVEVVLDNGPFVLRVTRRTEVVWQATDGKRTPARLDDVRAGPDADVVISYCWPLAHGEPPVAPATRIILDTRSKRPR
jgi:hypothetical protein